MHMRPNSLRPALLGLLLPLGLLPTVAQGQATPGSIVGEMLTRQQERWQGIEDFTIVQETLGNRIPQYYEAFNAGNTMKGFRLVPLPEIERRRLAEQGVAPPTSGELAAMADGYEMVGELLASEMEREGLPLGLAGLSRAFGGMAHDMLMAAATYPENDGRDDGTAAMMDLARFGQSARLVGTEAVANRTAYHLRVEDFGAFQIPEGEVDFDPTGISVWIDTEDYVPLRMLIEGTATADGQTAPITIEKVSHAWGDDEGLFLAQEEIMRLGGPMFIADERRRREMREALDQLDNMEAQLEGLSESQRDMVMARIAPQIAQLERMAAGEPITVVTHVVEVRVNEGPPYDLAEIVFGGR